MKIDNNRFDPSRLSPDELDQLANMVIEKDRPTLVGHTGMRLELPDPIFHLLVRGIRMMREGRAVVLMPEDETVTTQAAATSLGVSRQFFVSLLETGQIPFHRVGAHRRVYCKDLAEYRQKRDQERRERLDKLFKAVEDAGVYETTLPATHEQD